MQTYIALIPIFLLILLGYVLMHLNMPGKDFWPAMEKLTYFVLFPALLVSRLSTAPLADINLLSLSSVLILCIFIISALLLLLRPWLFPDGPAFSSVYQGSVRFNSYVGLALADQFIPHHGVALAAIAMAAMIPLLNVLCVVILAVYASHQPLQWDKLGLSLLKNPLIMGCVIGLTLNFTTGPLPEMVNQSLVLLGKAALPMGLLAVGAGLHLGSVHSRLPCMLLSSILKLLAFPALAWGLGVAFQLDAAELSAAVLFAALPSATSSYILARQMGGDYTLMASILTMQTAAAIITLPLVLSLFIL